VTPAQAVFAYQPCIGSRAGLEVSAIDPEKAIQEYRDHVMASKGAKLDDAGRAALAEDLMSPCTEEIAVFQQFSRAVNKARDQFVIMDTAPTGHTLLLMDATGSYHRDITRHLDDDQRGHVETTHFPPTYPALEPSVDSPLEMEHHGAYDVGKNPWSDGVRRNHQHRWQESLH